MDRLTVLLASIVTVSTAASCGGDDATSTTAEAAETAATVAEGDGLFPDVLDAAADQSDDGTWTFDVTMTSPYDTPERYADAWRVLAPDGTELAVRELLHDHAGEQPFSRSLSGVEIPDDVTEVTLQGRDQLNGWGGATLTIDLD